MKAVDIKWDTDGDNELLKTLPKEMGVPEGLADDRISDYLSDVTGFCHHGFALEETNTHPIPIIPNILSQADRSELFGLLVDAVEDWLDKKGITPDMIPNDEREDEDSAIIYGSDYDYLADRFSEVLGIERDIDETLRSLLMK